MRGKELLPLTENVLVADLRMSRLASGSILDARDTLSNVRNHCVSKKLQIGLNNRLLL